MMSDDELADLALDIKANGLIHPIVLDTAGELLVDGRNRFKACELAGVEPEFERLNGKDDPADFIISANIARRNLIQGQRAILLAKIHPETRQGKRTSSESDEVGVSHRRLANARLILRYAPGLGDEVVAGTIALGMALLPHLESLFQASAWCNGSTSTAMVKEI
jgi:hypothetical protein